MLNETIDYLNVKENGVYIDCTLGGAGHALYLLNQLNDDGRLIAIDQDQTAIDNAKEVLKDHLHKVTFVHSNFRELTQILKHAEDEFTKHMNDDFNTPQAIAVLFNLVREGNQLIAQDKLDKVGAKRMLDFLKTKNEIFGILPQNTKPEPIPEKVLKLLEERESFRKEKDWIQADKIREKILEEGYIVEDSDDGAKLKKR